MYVRLVRASNGPEISEYREMREGGRGKEEERGRRKKE